jgi:hypothetical protein
MQADEGISSQPLNRPVGNDSPPGYRIRDGRMRSYRWEDLSLGSIETKQNTICNKNKLLCRPLILAQSKEQG